MKPTRYNRIKAVLAEKNITNKQLARELNVKQETVSRWCTNQSQPSVQVLYEIARYLKMDIRELLVPTDWNSR